jgi:hypothetical protein
VLFRTFIDKPAAGRPQSIMPTPADSQPDPSRAALNEIPDRLCTWCKVPMKKRLVADGQFVHYTCPKCIFQHASKRDRTTPPR